VGADVLQCVCQDYFLTELVDHLDLLLVKIQLVACAIIFQERLRRENLSTRMIHFRLRSIFVDHVAVFVRVHAIREREQRAVHDSRCFFGRCFFGGFGEWRPLIRWSIQEVPVVHHLGAEIGNVDSGLVLDRSLEDLCAHLVEVYVGNLGVDDIGSKRGDFRVAGDLLFGLRGVDYRSGLLHLVRLI